MRVLATFFYLLLALYLEMGNCCCLEGRQPIEGEIVSYSENTTPTASPTGSLRGVEKIEMVEVSDFASEDV